MAVSYNKSFSMSTANSDDDTETLSTSFLNKELQTIVEIDKKNFLSFQEKIEKLKEKAISVNSREIESKSQFVKNMKKEVEKLKINCEKYNYEERLKKLSDLQADCTKNQIKLKALDKEKENLIKHREALKTTLEYYSDTFKFNMTLEQSTGTHDIMSLKFHNYESFPIKLSIDTLNRKITSVDATSFISPKSNDLINEDLECISRVIYKLRELIINK